MPNYYPSHYKWEIIVNPLLKDKNIHIGHTTLRTHHYKCSVLERLKTWLNFSCMYIIISACAKWKLWVVWAHLWQSVHVPSLDKGRANNQPALEQSDSHIWHERGFFHAEASCSQVELSQKKLGVCILKSALSLSCHILLLWLCLFRSDALHAQGFQLEASLASDIGGHSPPWSLASWISNISNKNLEQA